MVWLDLMITPSINITRILCTIYLQSQSNVTEKVSKFSLFFFFLLRVEKMKQPNKQVKNDFPLIQIIRLLSREVFRKKQTRKKLPNAIKIQCFIAGMKWVFQVRLVKLDIVTLTTRITKLNLNG